MMFIWFPDKPVLLNYTFVTARYMMCIWFPSIPVLLLTVSNRMFIELITAVLIFVYPLFTGSLTDCLLTQISTSFVIKFELHL